MDKIPYKSELRDKADVLESALEAASHELYYMARFLCKTDEPFLVAQFVKMQHDLERSKRNIKRLLENRV